MLKQGNLINEIDKVEGKVFSGVLLLGAAIALANPLAGAAIAMKAVHPLLDWSYPNTG